MLPRNSARRRERGMGSAGSRAGAPGGGPSSLPGLSPMQGGPGLEERGEEAGTGR